MKKNKNMLTDERGMLLEYWIILFILGIAVAIAAGQKSLGEAVVAFMAVLMVFGLIIGAIALYDKLDARWKIARMKEKLKSPDPQERMDAAEKLGGMLVAAESMVPDLLEALCDPEQEVRMQAASALSKIGYDTGKAVPVLIEGLRSNDHALRRVAVEAIDWAGKEAGAAALPLAHALLDRNWDGRWQAAASLSLIGTLEQEVVEHLIKALDDPDELAVKWAAGALGHARSPAMQAVPALRALLGHDSRDIRGEAVKALGEIGSEAAIAVPDMIPALKDPDRWIRGCTAEALGKMGSAAGKAVPALKNGAFDPDDWVREKISEAVLLITK